MADRGGFRASWGNTGSGAANDSPFATYEGGGGDDGMSDRVTRLETHFGYIRRDMDEVKSDLKDIKETLKRLDQFPTKADLWSWKIQYTALSVGAIAIIVGGIVGGLSWIKPDAAPPAPVVITLPPQAAPAK